MTIEQELIALKAPANVRDAGKTCEEALQAGLRPPRSLVEYIERWVNRQRGNNRYGK